MTRMELGADVLDHLFGSEQLILTSCLWELDCCRTAGRLVGRMARKLRVQYPGAVYHVMNRGDRREAIFVDDKDRGLLLETLEEACLKTDLQVHAWCLMSNHFHLVVETPRGNPVEGMQWLLGGYTNRLNHQPKESGHLFSSRYMALQRVRPKVRPQNT